jgi:hypothetical protein
MNLRSFVIPVILATHLAVHSWAQAISGDLVGSIQDSTKAAVSSATVEAANTATNAKTRTRSDSSGEYRFTNLLPGTYELTATADGFAPSSLKGLLVEANKISTVILTLQPGQVTSSVNVTDAAAVIDTTTATIGNSFNARQARDLPVSSIGLNTLNLALLNAGVASNGGLNAGRGPSVGGQRPRNNNFTIEGVDNNYKTQTGAILTVPNDAVAETTVMQNIFSAEFGHSSGGQFNVILKSGTNSFHGSVYEYFQNRNLNAIDEQFANSGITGKPRYDANRLGAAIGGPILRNKLFFFGSYEYNPIGQSTTPGENLSPTAAGFNLLSSLSGLSANNLSVFKKYVPVASTSLADTSQYPVVSGMAIPVGLSSVVAPNYQNNYAAVASIDYNISDSDQLRVRDVYNRADTLDHAASLPAFFLPSPAAYHLATVSEYHNFTPSLTNEIRVGFNHLATSTSSGNFQFPGLDSFPNLVFGDLNGLQVGPNPNAPQHSSQNTYQLTDNNTWTRGRHTFTTGFEGRRAIAPTSFVQRERGDYEYSTLNLYLHDTTPDDFAYRVLGNPIYYGNDWSFFGYANDSFRYRPNLTFNLGVRYEYTTVPYSDRLQALNAVSSVPGVLTFGAPTSQQKNFAPRVGVAWSPGNSSTTSIRAGFGIVYDVIYDNIGVNSAPPQFSTAVDVTGSGGANFLANGGILPQTNAGATSVAALRAQTSAYIPDQKLPYSIQWNVGVQRVFARDYTFEARYLGTRGVHLDVQTHPFTKSPLTPTNSLPTYLQQPSQATLNALPVTLAQLQAQPVILPQFAAAGFTNAGLTEYVPTGNSTYHGLALQMNKRWSNNLQFTSAYTWSHLIDDSTADFFTTLLTPRRPEDFQNLRAERSSSALDHRHRVTLSFLYDVPVFRHSQNVFPRNIIGNWSIAPIYTYESPEYVTALSQTDATLNHDVFTDRTVINLNGQDGVGSGVTPVMNGAGQVVAYVANNPNARYIVAGPGVLPTAGRNTLAGRPIDNIDFNVMKNFRIRERATVQFSAQFFNLLNHAQFVPGFVNRVDNPTVPSTSGGIFNYLTPGNALFNNPEAVFSSNPRTTQLALKIIF